MLLTVLLISCPEPRMMGPLFHLADTYWQLERVKIGDQVLTAEEFGQSRKLAIRSGHPFHYRFYLNDSLEQEVGFLDNGFFDRNRNTRDEYIYSGRDTRTFIDYGFRLIVTGPSKQAGPNQIEISNLIRGDYTHEKDTIRYFYRPTESFE